MDGPQREEVSKARRYMLFGLACTHVLLASGEAYGWTALRPVLIADDVLNSDPTKQASRMNAVATMGIAANALCKFPLGLLLDRCGPRATSVVGAFIMIAGSLLMSFADKDDQYMLMGGYFLLGTAGPFLQMPCFQFSELFGNRKASAMAYLITCFELSTGVFWVFGVLHSSWGLDRRALFMGYATVGAYALVTALFFWPDLPYRAPPPPHTVRYVSPRAQPNRATKPTPPHNPSKPLMDKPLFKQIFSVPFAYVVLFLTLHIFRQGFLLATIGPQVEDFFADKAVSEQLKTAFNIILPLGFIPMMLCTASGFAAYILDRPRLAFVVVTLLSMVYGLLLLVHEQWSFLVLFVVFPVARQFVFSTFFSFSANTFGYASFGRIAGVASTVAGLVQLTQTKLVQFTTEHTWGLNWFLTDAFLGLVPTILFIYPVYSGISQMLRDSSKGDAYSSVNAHGDDDDTGSPTSPLMGYSNRNAIKDSIHAGDDDEEEQHIARVHLPHIEATSYGSHSASSFAALYTQYMEDVKVSVVPVAEDEDRSIHVAGLPGSHTANLHWPSASWADHHDGN